MPKVLHEICGGRLQIGGRWYFNGQHVELDENDALIYASRGFTRPVVPKRGPVSDPERQSEAPKEMLRPEQVSPQTKEQPEAPTNDVLEQPPAPAPTPAPPPPAPAPAPKKEQSNGKHRKADS